jgi:group I intron endonuclease
MVKTGKIYLISNDVNDKLYIGQTVQTLKKRFTGHCCYSKSDRSDNMLIKRVIHKYGKEHFKIELLEECPIDKLNEREAYWIDKFDSYNNGYNLTLGGQASNYFSLHRVEDSIDIKKFEQYIIEFKPLAKEVASHFNISRCSVYNLIKRLNNPNLILNTYNPKKPVHLTDEDIANIIDLYSDGWSIIDISKKYKTRKHRISNVLKNNGIKIHRGIKGYKRRI